MRSASSLGWWKASTWTLNEALLKFHTSQPKQIFKVHCCDSTCNQEEVGDALLHLKKARRMREDGAEEGWVSNLQSPPGRRRRRTPRFEAQGPGSARGHSEGRRPWSAQERRSEGEGFRDFRNEEKEEERQEEEEKGQEQEEGEGFERRRDRLERRRQVGWQPAQEGLRQEGALVVCWDGARSEGVRQGPGGSAGKKAYEEESRERQFQQQQQWQQSEHLGPRRGGGRDSVCPGVKSAGACGPLSGSTMLPGNRADEDDAAARSGPGRQTRDPATSSGGLLPSAAAAPCLRAFPAGADDPDIGDRPPIERESSSSCGLADTASEKYRTYHGRLTLDCQPTPRDPARRASDPHSERRSLSGAKRALPGDEAAQPSSKSGGEARPKRGKVSDRGKGDYKGKGGDRERKGGKGQGQKGEAPKKEGEK